MNNKNLLPILLLTLLLISCSGENKPKLTYDDQQQLKETAKDSSSSLISKLPIQIDSTEYLIHPVGEFRIINYSGSYSGSSSYSSNGYDLMNRSSKDEFSGSLSNLKFQHIESESLITLTDKKLMISSVTFLREVFATTGKQHLLYRIVDSDSNKNGKMDYNDLNTFYISTITGKNFRKITPEDQEGIDWAVISNMNRLYFRSVADTNRNGEFDKEDKLQYFYIDFDTEDLNVEEYFPV